MLAPLVACASVSSQDPLLDQSNRAVVELLAQWCADLGARVEVVPIPGHAGKVNLIATLGEGAGGLVLAGHTDTVPWDADRWQSDPFVLQERGGRLYGLGATDMKGFFPIALAAMAQADAGRLRAPIVLLATADEESSMSGARALAAAGRRLGRHAVIGEPTAMRPVRAHKGIVMARILVRGRAGHASNPALGNSALEGMHAVMAALLAWRAALQARWQDPVFEVPGPTLNLGCIHGGDNPNRICADCELQIDLRLLPSMPPEEILHGLRDRVADALAGTGLGFSVEPMIDPVPPFATAAGAPIVAAAERLTGSPAGTVGFASEAPMLAAAGMDVLLFGPGDIECAHQPDESIDRARVAPAVDILRGLIRRFCVERSDD